MRPPGRGWFLRPGTGLAGSAFWGGRGLEKSWVRGVVISVNGQRSCPEAGAFSPIHPRTYSDRVPIHGHIYPYPRMVWPYSLLQG